MRHAATECRPGIWGYDMIWPLPILADPSYWPSVQRHLHYCITFHMFPHVSTITPPSTVAQPPALSWPKMLWNFASKMRPRALKAFLSCTWSWALVNGRTMSHDVARCRTVCACSILWLVWLLKLRPTRLHCQGSPWLTAAKRVAAKPRKTLLISWYLLILLW